LKKWLTVPQVHPGLLGLLPILFWRKQSAWRRNIDMSPPLSYNAVFVLVILELPALWKNYSRQVWRRRLHPSEETKLD
jgi:hypothetical protein